MVAAEISMDARAVECIDDFLKEISGQKLVDTGKVIDFCLDLRQIFKIEEEA
jgi:hypothetical protein